MKVKDNDGNEIEVFTQEELDAKLKETTDKAVADALALKEKEASDKAKAEADAAAAGAGDKDEIPSWAKPIVAAVQSLSQNHTMGYVEKVSTGLDADRRKLVETKFSSLTGYEDTAEGMQRRAEDAYLLATGEKFNAGTVNMGNLVAGSGGRTVTDSKAVTEADKNIQSALGITTADVEKFAKK